ncbi:MAG: ankyrin repeat domain-containing protein [Planctomycetia bacterium]|nr:ankyrin repeat domain-containing protein [Planctomycetia bacterium]
MDNKFLLSLLRKYNDEPTKANKIKVTISDWSKLDLKYALMIMVFEGKMQAVRLLIDEYNVEALENYQGRNIIHCAVSSGNIELLDYIRNRKEYSQIDINATFSSIHNEPCGTALDLAPQGSDMYHHLISMGARTLLQISGR